MVALIDGFLTDNPMLMGQVVSAVAVVVGGLWARYLGSEWREGLRQGRKGKALDAIEAGVEVTAREYVRKAKAASKDGKLTRKEIQNAQSAAIDRAKRFAREEGIDLLKELGANLLQLHVSLAVERQKTGAVRAG